MITIPMIIAFSLNPLPQTNNLPLVPKTVPTVEQIVLDNFNDGETSLSFPTSQSLPLISTASGLKGVLNGVRYIAVTVDGCNKDPLFCGDVRVNSRKSGVLSVAFTNLLPDHVGEVRISYSVDIDDLREYTFSIKDLELDETAKQNLFISIVANGIEYPLDINTLTYDFYNISGGNAVNVKSFEVKFKSSKANDFVVDNLEFTRRKKIVPDPVPALGSMPLLPLATVASVLPFVVDGSGSSEREEIVAEFPSTNPPIEIPIEIPVVEIPTIDKPIVDSPKPLPPTEPVPEPTTIVASLFTAIVGWIAKMKQR